MKNLNDQLGLAGVPLIASMRDRALAAWAQWERDRERHPLQLDPGDLDGDLPPGWRWIQGQAFRWPSWVQRPRLGGLPSRRARLDVNVTSGLHPTGHQMHPGALLKRRTKCGRCAHATPVVKDGGAFTWWFECSKALPWPNIKNVRAKWGACEHYEERE